MDYKYTGIILNKKDIGETDRIYTIYTLEAGKIRALAKSVRRSNAKLAGFLENFNLAEVFVSKSQGMGKITGSIVINNFPKLRKNIEAVQNIFSSTKILDRLIKDEGKDEKIFKFLREYIEAVEDLEEKEKLEIVSLGFVFKILEELGYRIEVGGCLECGDKIKEGDNFFNPESGGIICANCFIKTKKGFKITSNSIKLLRIFFKNSLKSLAKIRVGARDIDNLKTIEREFLSWII